MIILFRIFDTWKCTSLSEKLMIIASIFLFYFILVNLCFGLNYKQQFQFLFRYICNYMKLCNEWTGHINKCRKNFWCFSFLGSNKKIRSNMMTLNYLMHFLKEQQWSHFVLYRPLFLRDYIKFSLVQFLLMYFKYLCVRP